MCRRAILAVCCGAVLLSCGQRPVTKQEAPKPSTALPVITGFTLRSPAFADNGPIPVRYTGRGENISPALSWYNPPPATQGFVLILDDPDAPGGAFTHWVIYNLPKDANALPEAVGRAEMLPSGGRQARNSFGKIGYDGPMPPPGKVHHYVFTLYALDNVLDAAAPTKNAVMSVLANHTLAKTVLTGTYQQ